jgi:hypothetical protein
MWSVNYFFLLCPQLFQSDASRKSQAAGRSRKSVAWKAKLDPLKSIFGDGLDQSQNQTKRGRKAPSVSRGSKEVCE